MLQKVKKWFFNSNLGITILICIPILVFSILFLKNYFGGIVLFIFLVLSICITISISDYLGKKRHFKIIENKSFQKLISEGFQIEKKDEYIGLTGIFEDYIIDIYYDWNTFIKRKIGKAYVINIYFNPQKPLDKINCANYNFIIKMREKYWISSFSLKNYDIDFSEANLSIKNRVGLSNPSYEQIIDRLKIGVDILKQENLTPMDRKMLNHIRTEFKFQCIPSISL